MDGRTILIVDDEPLVQKGLAGALKAAGYSVETALNGLECLAKMRTKRPDLILLDVQMPRMDGFRTCVEIRKIDAAVPIVFHSVRESPDDIMEALGSLGDSYIFKREPETVKIAKIEAVLRRADMAKQNNAAGQSVGSKFVSLGGVKADVRECYVSVGGKKTVLTKTEACILEFLDMNRGRICSKEDIYMFLYGDGFKGDARNLRTHFCHLREKLGSAARYVENIHGVGYRLRDRP